MTWKQVIILCTGVLSVLILTLYGGERREKALALTHRERVSMCNAKGMLFSDGVCQRIYINMCRPAPTPCKRE